LKNRAHLSTLPGSATAVPYDFKAARPHEYREVARRRLALTAGLLWKGLLGCQSFSDLAFNDVPDEAPVAFEERQLVCEHTLQENTYAVMTGHVGCSDQRNVFG
jgi:hypothetical protein